MAVNNLKKINVRSPYYITVARPVSQGGEGDDVGVEPDVDVTEPVNQENTITCGSTTQVGVDVGTRIFKISTTGRQLGYFSITFAGIKTPIKYRIGHSANMPSFATAGLDSYAAAWNTATGESPTLSDFAANPNGVAATATYISTQSDIDLYGEEIQLEIQQPIITEDYSFSLSCPALAEDTVPADGGFVVIISFTKNQGIDAATANVLSINGANLGSLPVGSTKDTDRYVMTDQTPTLLPKSGNYPQQNIYGENFFNKSQFGTSLNRFKDENVGRNISVIYKPEHIIGSGINDLKVENTGFAVSAAKMTIMISRHPVQEVAGTKYILGSNDGVAVKALQLDFKLGQGDILDMSFRGSNSTALEGLLAIKTNASNAGTTDWDENTSGLGDESDILTIREFTIQPA